MTIDAVEGRLRRVAKRRGLTLSRHVKHTPVQGVFYYIYDRNGIRVSPAEGMLLEATEDWFRNTEYRVLDPEDQL